MRFLRTFVLAFLSLPLAFPVWPQQTATTTQPSPQRDPQALAVLQAAVAAMGGSVPSDSSAAGSVTIVEGSTTQTGTIQVLTRGTGQTAESITVASGQRAVIYSNGDAKEVSGSQTVSPPLELAVTDQCPDFPIPLLFSALNNPDEGFTYIGQETLNAAVVQHIEIWNTFASNSHLRQLAPFSMKDIWFESTSGLPVKVAYTRRTGGIAQPSVAVEVWFSSYNNVSGVLYPFQIKKSYNGTPWQTITIQSVAFNTGLSDSQFQVE